MLRTNCWMTLAAAGCGIVLAMAGVVGAEGAPALPPPRPGPTPHPYPVYPPYPYPPVQIYVNNPTPPAGNSISSTNGSNDKGTSSQQGPPSQKAYVRVFLPDARAQVSFDGHATSATGASRLFETPPLQPGKTHLYTVTATWLEHGRPVKHERKVIVVPGQYAMANFTVPAFSEAIPAPLPPPSAY